MFIAKYENEYTYFIIMDKLNGDMYDLLSDPIFNDDVKEEIAKNMFNAVKNVCDIFKKKPYLFTHTDLKAENVFYKLFDTEPVEEECLSNVHKITIRGENKFIAYYVADFDKSSITYKNIRFYNNGGTLNTQSSSYSSLQDVNMYNIQKNESKKMYNLDRVIGTSIIDYKNIEIEQLYIRYTRFPYYTSFDYVSLLLSMAIATPNNIISRKMSSIANEYIHRSSSLLEFYENFKWATKDKYNGNFGTLIASLITKAIPYNLIHNIEENVICPQTIKKLLLSHEENKLCLSPPFYMSSSTIRPPEPSGALGALYNAFSRLSGYEPNIYLMNEIPSKRLYESNFNNNIFEKMTENEIKNYTILYTGDIHKEPSLIVKTNKYSSSVVTTRVYNYDNFNIIDIKQSLPFFEIEDNEEEEDFEMV
jgi:hypothetical protein